MTQMDGLSSSFIIFSLAVCHLCRRDGPQQRNAMHPSSSFTSTRPAPGRALLTGHRPAAAPASPLLGAMAAALSLLFVPASASSAAPPPPSPPPTHSIVRVEDVESPAMRAGFFAANDGRLPEAERLFRVALAQLEGEVPPSVAAVAAAHSNLGNVLLQEGRTQAALAELDAAVALAPGAAVPLLNRSLVFEQLAVDEEERGDPAKAAPLLAAALADASDACVADPTEAAAFYDAGGILQRLGRHGDALAAFKTAADLAPGLPGYRLRAATLMFQQGDVAGAGRTMRGVTRRAPQYGEAHAAAAAVAWAAGEGGRAEASLDAALNLDSAWKKEAHVREATRWPPALVAAYGRLLRLEGPGPGV